MTQKILPQIKTVVFLMLENRSLDNVLGWTYGADAPANVFPLNSPRTYDGVYGKSLSNPAYTWTGAVKNYPVVPVPSGLGADQDRVPAYDPYEEMKVEGSWNGVLNQLFGNQNMITGMPSSGAPARCLGYLSDYYAKYMVGWQGLDILWTYTPNQLPMINWLARQYAVSDRWFCSVPTQTNPNRAFSLCGTSLGRENNANLFADEQFDVPTVFNALAGAGKSWGLYFTDVWKQNKSYTEYTFPWISNVSGSGEAANISQFFARARSGTLPNFTYLEPTWGYGKGTFFKQGTDMHPPTHVLPGDQFLRQVYEAVRMSPQWNETLFIVTFDEHGGTYDHVAPPWGAINPDGRIGKDGFRFDLFGARVPTILISPFVRPSTVFREPEGSRYPYDHTSFIKTLLLWAGVDPNSAGLGKRVPAAPTFEGVLFGDQVNAESVASAPMTLEAPLPQATVPGMDEPPPGGAGHPVNAIFEGVSFTATRAIIDRNESLEGMIRDVEAYKANPDGFEAALI